MKRDEERKRLKALRREEIEKKLALVKEVAGNIKGTPYEGRVVCVWCVRVGLFRTGPRLAYTNHNTAHNTMQRKYTHTTHNQSCVVWEGRCMRCVCCAYFSLPLSLAPCTWCVCGAASVGATAVPSPPCTERGGAKTPLSPHGLRI